MENRKLKFREANTVSKILSGSLQSVDFKTGYAVRRTLRSLSDALQDAITTAKEKTADFDAYNQMLADAGKEPGDLEKAVAEAEKKYKTAHKVQGELMEQEIDFQVHPLPTCTLDKPWPMVPPVPGREPPEPVEAGQWLTAIAALDMIEE